MPVTYDDTFFDDLGAALPALSVKFLNRAASWSARNSRSGFVTATAAAELTDDVDRDTAPLKAAGIIRRARKGGWQIAEGAGITIVNARDAAQQARQEEAETARRRELGRVRAQRKRDRDKAARAAAMTGSVTRDVTQESREKVPNVTRYESTEPKKQQVKPKNVTRYAAGSSRVTPQIDDLDLYLDQSLETEKSKSDARSREEAALVAEVTDLACAEHGFTPDEAQVRSVIAAIDERIRARKTRTRVRSRRGYVLQSAKDPGLWKRPAPAPPAADAPRANPWVPAERHEYQPGRGYQCRKCNRQQSNLVHDTTGEAGAKAV